MLRLYEEQAEQCWRGLQVGRRTRWGRGEGPCRLQVGCGCIFGVKRSADRAVLARPLRGKLAGWEQGDGRYE